MHTWTSQKSVTPDDVKLVSSVSLKDVQCEGQQIIQFPAQNSCTDKYSGQVQCVT